MSWKASSKSPGPRRTLVDRVKGLPAWLSAIAAIGGMLVAAAGVYVAANNQRPAEAATPAPPPSVVAPRVTIESVLVDGQQIQADGIFQFIDPTREEILFIGRPSGSTEDPWVAVEAALTPREQLGSLQNGDWSASRPAPPPAPYRWRVIVWPSGSGASANEDLQVNGPDSQFVIARSEEWLEP